MSTSDGLRLFLESKRKIVMKRRDSTREFTCDDRVFEAAPVLPAKRSWVIREYYGPSVGWSEETKYRTLADCREHVADRCGL